MDLDARAYWHFRLNRAGRVQEVVWVREKFHALEAQRSIISLASNNFQTVSRLQIWISLVVVIS